MMACTSCQENRGLRGISADVLTALSTGDEAALARIREANPISIWAATQTGGAVSALGGAAVGFAAAGTGRGAATGALLGYGVESAASGTAMLLVGGRIEGASAVSMAGAFALLGGVMATIGGIAMAYHNFKRRGR